MYSIHALLFLFLFVVLWPGTTAADDESEVGQKIFGNFEACHTTDVDKHEMGPSFANLIGLRAALTACGAQTWLPLYAILLAG